MIPIVAARGNHEDSNANLIDLFDVPSNNVYYALTFGDNLIRTYTLNTEISMGGSQRSWLASDLANSNDVIWKMAQYHKPMRPHTSNKPEGTQQYSNWADLFEQHRVNLVVECDIHMAKTTWPIVPSNGAGSYEGFIRDDCNGTVYTGEGSWGAPLRSNNDDKPWTRNSGSFNQFKWIFVDQDNIELRTIQVDNANSVGQVSDNNIFLPPANLDIWDPSNGSVVTISGDTDNSGTPDVCEPCLLGAAGNGDVNGDGEMNVFDAYLVARYAVDLIEGGDCGSLLPSTLLCVPRADINCDGEVNILDAHNIARCAVGLEEAYCPN